MLETHTHLVLTLETHTHLVLTLETPIPQSLEKGGGVCGGGGGGGWLIGFPPLFGSKP